MRRAVLILLTAGCLTAALGSPGRAGSEADFKAAIAAAEAAHSEAGRLKNQWTTTAQQLAAAKQAAAAGELDKAVRLARLAEMLAQASIAQAREQEEAWRALEIR
ncbi:MAG TPA: hypothetical protein VGF60_09570 [Xanthobacteraceae bacterium]|jgi:hypothetical protein